MRQVINVDENHELYQSLTMMADEAIRNKQNAQIVARGRLNKKPEVKPIKEIRDISFYAVYDAGIAFIFGQEADEETIRLAIENTIRRTKIISMDDALKSVDFDPSPIEDWNPEDSMIFIITNAEKSNGAGILLCDEFLHKVWERIGNYFIAPSSIHELIIFKDTEGLTMNDFNAMVRNINNAIVMDEERLSDKAFYYDGSLQGGAE